MTPLAFLNGELVPPDELAVSVADAGFVSGATVTDFARTYRHRLFRYGDHLARLRRDAVACHIPLPISDEELTAVAERLVAHNAALLPAGDDLAVVTFATPGPVGYMGFAPTGPTVGMHTFPLLKDRYRRFFEVGVDLVIAGTLPTDPAAPVGVGVKHRSRVQWWAADQRTREAMPGAVAALRCPGGLDTGVGTVLAVEDGTLHVPPTGTVLDSVTVPVVRELCDALRIPVAEAFVSGYEPELLLAGSAFGVAGVRSCDGRPCDWPGPVTQRLVAAWVELVGVDVAAQFRG